MKTKLTLLDGGDEDSSLVLAKKMQVITAAIDLLMASEYRKLYPKDQAASVDWLNWETEEALRKSRQYN
jgi:hypothetical protein